MKDELSIQNLQDVVETINQEIYEHTDAEYIEAVLSTLGWGDYVDFCGIRVWDSETDDRLYIDEENDIKEPIDLHLRRAIMDEIRKLNRISL